GETVLVDAKTAEGARRTAAGFAFGFALIASDPALRRIVFVAGQTVVFEAAAGRERPFFVARQAVALAGLAGQPARIVDCVRIAHLHRRPVGCDSHAALERAAGAVIDAGLIVGGADLMPHDGKRLFENDCP